LQYFFQLYLIFKIFNFINWYLQQSFSKSIIYTQYLYLQSRVLLMEFSHWVYRIPFLNILMIQETLHNLATAWTIKNLNPSFSPTCNGTSCRDQGTGCSKITKCVIVIMKIDFYYFVKYPLSLYMKHRGAVCIIHIVLIKLTAIFPCPFLEAGLSSHFSVHWNFSNESFFPFLKAD